MDSRQNQCQVQLQQLLHYVTNLSIFKIIELFVLSTRDYSPSLVFTINMFVSISAICSNWPLYVLQIKDPQSVSTVSDGSLRSELNKTSVCCSGFLITKPNTATCLENGKWELEASQMKNEG